MPDRIVRSNIITSERVDQLSPEGEVFYRRLMHVVDDFGLYDARPSILLAALYPLKLEPGPKQVKAEDIVRWLVEVVNTNPPLVRLYGADGKPYLELLSFGQRLRGTASKWPRPPALGGNPPQSAADRREPPTSAADRRLDVVVVGDVVEDVVEDGIVYGKGRAKKPAALPPLNPRPIWLPKEWEEYEQERAKSKHPMTELARQKAVAKLERLKGEGYDIAAIINDSIEAGWTGLFEKPKHKTGTGKAPNVDYTKGVKDGRF